MDYGARPRDPMTDAKSFVKAIQAISVEKLNDFAVKIDGWANDLTGFGTSRDKTTYGRFYAAAPLSDTSLSALYHHNDMAARMVDVIPDEMFRKGFKFKVEDAGLTNLINDKMVALGTAQRFTEAARWGRLFGGAAIIIGADDGKLPETPLDPERANDIRWLRVVDRRYIQPVSYYQDEKSFKFGQVETYRVTPNSNSGRTHHVHESRVILFGGAPTGDQERTENTGWDYSVLQRPHNVLRQFDTGWTAVENLLTDGHQTVYKMSGLADAIAAGESDYLTKRAKIVDMARSVVRAMVIDAGNPAAQEASEEFLRHSVSFADIPAVLDKFMLRLSAAVQIPVTILMGQSPAGMSATGESDFRWFYDRVDSERVNRMNEPLTRLADIWLRTKAGREVTKGPVPPVKVDWPSLWSETPLAEAQRRAANATADSAYVMAGVYLPEEIAISRSLPEGYGEEIKITDDARRSREQIIKDDLDKAESGEDEEENDSPPSSPDASPEASASVPEPEGS